MEGFKGLKVVDVACGSRDAQTLCVTSDGQVWSWGDGDFGKLGRGGSTGSLMPEPIRALANKGVVSVHCGAQFSAALTKDGIVWVW